jgi:4-azaleucine resistance transporter AzlC
MILPIMQQKRSVQFLSSVGKGVKHALPIMLGCIPIGTAYGILTQQAGLSLWAAMALSLLVFAGASQFMAVSMMQNGMEPGAIIGATFIINFRHVLMSASIAPHLKCWKTWQRTLLGGMLTDESYILLSLNFEREEPNFVLAVALNTSIYIMWAASGFVGYNHGAVIANPEVWGLDFALPAMFIGLILSACKNKMGVIAAITGGIVSLALHLMNSGNLAVFLGGLGGAIVGALFYAKEGADS